jgi:hypothetical protein
MRPVPALMMDLLVSYSMKQVKSPAATTNNYLLNSYEN